MVLKVKTQQVGLEDSIESVVNRINRRGLKVRINSNDFTQPLGRITQKADEFTKSLEASNARVIAFGASAAIIGSVAKGFEQLVVQAVKFEKLLTDINVVLGTSSTNLAKFGDNLFKVARNTSQALDVAAEAALEFSRQGLSMEETLRRTNDALILTRLTGIKAADAVSGLTAAVNGFADAGLTTTSIINKLAAVDVKFAVSADDLINALARAGAVAQDAGVNFDQLVGAVTSAQQITARGGAVIGNSFKTIFTRIQRSSTLDRLQELGIAVRDIRGATLPALTVLTNLSKTYDTLGSSTKAAVAEQVGGVFQINVLKAALKDLNRENSLYAQATQISNNATDQAQQKNAQLQKTIASLATQTSLSIQELSANIGELALAPGISKLLDAINSLGTGLNDLLGKNAEGVGADVGKAIVRGIGSVITGPGMVLAFGIFAKLFGNALKFAKSSLKDVLGIVTQKEKERQIQESIVMAMNNNKTLAEELNRMSGNKLKQEELILAVIKKQTESIAAQQNIARSIAPGLARKGVNPDLTLNPKTGGAASGFIPNFSSSVTPFERAKERGAAVKAGYSPGDVSDIDIKGVGRVVYNTAETVKKFPGMQQPAIMPPKDSDAGKKYKYKFAEKHGFNPYAFNGFIPNFADPRTRSQKIKDVLNDPANKGIKFKNLGSGKNIDFKLKSPSDRRFIEIFLQQKTGDGSLYLDRLRKISGYSESQINNLRQLRRSFHSGSPVSLNGKEVLQSGFIPNFSLSARKIPGTNILELPKARMFTETSKRMGKGINDSKMTGTHMMEASIDNVIANIKDYMPELEALKNAGVNVIRRKFQFSNIDKTNRAAKATGNADIRKKMTNDAKGKYFERQLSSRYLKSKGYISTPDNAKVDFIKQGQSPIEAKFGGSSVKDADLIAKSIRLYRDKSIQRFLESQGMRYSAQSMRRKSFEDSIDLLKQLGIDTSGTLKDQVKLVKAYNLAEGLIPNFIQYSFANKDLKRYSSTKSLKERKKDNLQKSTESGRSYENVVGKVLGQMPTYNAAMDYSAPFRIAQSQYIGSGTSKISSNIIAQKHADAHVGSGHSPSDLIKKFLNSGLITMDQIDQARESNSIIDLSNYFTEIIGQGARGDFIDTRRSNKYGVGFSFRKDVFKPSALKSNVSKSSGFIPNFMSGISIKNSNFTKEPVLSMPIFKDGDSVDAVVAKKPANVDHRLSFVDAVEKDQDLGVPATKLAQNFYNGEAGRKLLEKNRIVGGKAAYGRGLFRDDNLAKQLVRKGLGVPDLRYTNKAAFATDLKQAIDNKSGIWSPARKDHPKRKMYEYQSGMLSGEKLSRRLDLDPSKTSYHLGGYSYTQSELKEIEDMGIDAWEKKRGHGGKKRAKGIREALLYKESNKRKASGFIPNFAANVFARRSFVYRPQGGKDWYTQLGGTSKHMNQFVKWLETNKKLPPQQMQKLKSQFTKEKDSYEKSYWDESKSIKSGASSVASRRGFYGTNATSGRPLPGEEKTNLNITDPNTKLFIKKDKMDSLINEWKNSPSVKSDLMFFDRGFVPNFADNYVVQALAPQSGFYKKGNFVKDKNQAEKMPRSRAVMVSNILMQNRKIKSRLLQMNDGMLMGDSGIFDRQKPGRAIGFVPNFVSGAGIKDTPFRRFSRQASLSDQSRKAINSFVNANRGMPNIPISKDGYLGLSKRNFETAKQFLNSSQFRQLSGQNQAKILDSLQSQAKKLGLGRFNITRKWSQGQTNKESILGGLGNSTNNYRLSGLGYSSGLIPNFTNPLAEAVRREKQAGLPDSKIRIDQDNRLKSKDNPLGLAVTNTRDEPLGVQQGIERARAMGIDPKTHGASSGLIPNFNAPQVNFDKLSPLSNESKKATNSIKNLGSKSKKASKEVNLAGDASGGLMTGMFALTSITYALEGAIGDTESTFGKVSKTANSLIMGLSQGSLIYSGLNTLGNEQIKKGGTLNKMFGRVSKAGGIVGSIFGTIIPVTQALKENFDFLKSSSELINASLTKANQKLDNLSTASTSLESAQTNSKRIIELEAKGRQRTIAEDKELIQVKQSQLKTELTLKSSLNELTKSTKLSAEQQLQLKGSYEDQVSLMNDLQSAQLRYITTLNEAKYASERDKEAGSEASYWESFKRFTGITDAPDPKKQKAEFDSIAKDFAKSFASINIDSNVVSEDPDKLLDASRKVRGKFQDRLMRSKSDQAGGDFFEYNIKDIFKDSFKELGEAAGLKGSDLSSFQSAGISKLESRYKDFDQLGFGSEIESQAVLDQMIAIALEFENVAKESKNVKKNQAAAAKKVLDVNRAIDLGKNAWNKSALKTEIYSSIIDERISNMQRTLSFEQDYNKLLAQQFINSNTTTNLNKAIEATQISYMSKISKIEEERLSAERDYNVSRAKQIEKLLKDGDQTMVKLGQEGDQNALMGPDNKVQTSKLRITKPKQIESQDGELRDTNEMETSIINQVTKEIQSRVQSVQDKEGIVSGENIGAIIKDATSNTSEQFLNQGATQDEITNAMMAVLEVYKQKGFLASRGNQVEENVNQSLGEAKRLLDQKNSSLDKQEKNAKDLQSKEEQLAKEKEGELSMHRKNMADLSARSGEIKSTEIKNLSASNNVLEKNLKLLEIKGSIYNTEEGLIELARSELLERGKSIEIQKQRNDKLFALLSNEEALVKITDKEISEKLRSAYGDLSIDKSTHEGMSKPQKVEDSPYSGMTGYQQKSMVAAEKEFLARQKLISIHEANIESGFYLEQAFTEMTTAGNDFTTEMIKARAKLSSGESFNEGVRSVERDKISAAQGVQKAQGKVAATQGNSITNSRAMVELTEAQRELNVQQNAGTLFADTMAVKMAEANKELAMFGQTLAETSFDAMRDGFRGLFDDLIDGSKSAGDAALNFFAGIAKKIQDKLLDRASTQLAVGFSDMLGLDDIGRNNSGGLIKGYAKGGTVGGGKVPSMLTAGEYVVKKKIVDRLGSGTLDSINETGSLDELYNKPNEDIFDITTEGAATIPPIMRFQDGGNVASYLTQRNMGYDRVSENERSTVNGEVVNDFTNALDSVFQKHNKQNVAGKHEKSYNSTYNNSNISNSIQHYRDGGGVLDKAVKGGSGKSGLQNIAEGGGYMLGSYLGTSQDPGEPPKAPEAPKNQRLNTRSRLNLDAAGADRSKMSQRFIANDSYTKEMKKYHLDMYEFQVQQKNQKEKERAGKIASIAGTAAIAGGMALAKGAQKMYGDYKHNQNMKHIDNAYTQMNIDNATASSMFDKSISDANKTLSLDYHTDVSSLKKDTIYGDNFLSADTRNYKNSTFSDTMNNLSSSKSISGGHYSSSSAFTKNYNSSSMFNSSKNSFASTEMENYLSNYDKSNQFYNTSSFGFEGEFNKGGVVNNKTIKPYSYYNKGGVVNVSNNPYSYFNKGGSVNNIANNPYSYFNRGGSVAYFNQGGNVNMSSNPYSYFNKGGSVSVSNNPYSYFNRGGSVINFSSNPYSYFNQGGSVYSNHSNPYSYFNSGGSVNNVSSRPYSYFNSGGLTNVSNSNYSPSFQSHSNIQKFSGGGKVNGPGGIDKVGPVLLDKGEYVIKASSVNKVEKKYPGFFDKLNSSKMKDGGKVGAEATINNATSNIENSKSSDNNSVVVNINISSNGSTSVDGGSESQQAFASKIKDAVTGIISQEKRVGGMLRGK